MIALLGSHGYIGSAFAEEMTRRGMGWVAVDYRTFESEIIFHHPSLVINCAAFIPKDTVSACDRFQAETLRGNLIFPMRLENLCERRCIPMAHLSTGYLWSDSVEHSEDDPPQRDFSGYAGFYIGTKVLAEQEVRRYPKHFIWRLSLAFDEIDNERNYLTKMANFPDVFDRENSITHRADFVNSCLDLWRIRAPFGTYNVMNPGSIKASVIVEKLIKSGIRKYWPSISKDQRRDSKASVKKLLSTGIRIRSAEEALDDSIRNWKICTPTT